MKNWTVDYLYPTARCFFLDIILFCDFLDKIVGKYWEIFLISNVVLYFCEEPLVSRLKTILVSHINGNWESHSGSGSF
jgi:hypothetical protein